MDPNQQQAPNQSNQYHPDPTQTGSQFATGQNVAPTPGQVAPNEQVYSIPTQGTNTENVRPGQSELEQQRRAAGGRAPKPRRSRGVQSIWTLFAIIFLTALLFSVIGGAVMFVSQQGKINVLEGDNASLSKEVDDLKLEVLTGGDPNILVSISELGVNYIFNKNFEDVQYAVDGNRVELGSKLLIEETRKAGGNDAQAAACSAGHAGTGFIYRLNKNDVLSDENEAQQDNRVDTFSEVTSGLENQTVRDLGDFYVILSQPNTFCSDTIDAEVYTNRFADTVSSQRQAFFDDLRATETNN